MIAGIFHQGSGLGNQLHRYVMTRVLAEDKGYSWTMLNPENFKGASFMKLDLGQDLSYAGTFQPEFVFTEKKVILDNIDVRGYDPEINFVNDNTLVEGEFQDERYFEHRLDEVRKWLEVEPLDMPENLCVINFRGGEYTAFPDLFLTADYWEQAISRVRRFNPLVEFEVHTDDPKTARNFFPDIPIIDNETIGHSLNTNMGYNWRAVRFAKYVILSNSSFGILPALLNENAEAIIAPRYWARRNTGVWALPQNYYKQFIYI